MHRKAIVALFAGAVLAWAGLAQDKPNLSGTWKLNVQKSDFGAVPGPTSQTDIIEQSGDTVKINVSAEGDQGKRQFTMTLMADGKEMQIPAEAPGAHPVPDVTMQSISSAWENGLLVVHEKLTYGSDPVTGVSHYTLSSDGKVLTVNSDYQSQIGEATRTFIFEKADASSADAPSVMKSSSSSSGSSSMGASSSSSSTGMSSSSAMSASSGTSSASSSGTSSGTLSSKPNLSGTWVLDASKSDFGQMPPPDGRTDTIEHKDPSFKDSVNSTGGPMGAMSYTASAVTDGKTVSTWTLFGSEAKTTARWEGNALIVHTDTKFQDQPVTFESRYTLSPDGNMLNVQGHFSGPMGEGDTKLVYSKK